MVAKPSIRGIGSKMNAQIENIKNPLLREFAEKTQHMSKGDFGMTIYGGVDLEAYAEMIIKECAAYMNGRTDDWEAKLRWIFNDGSGYMEVDVDSLLDEHFGIVGEE